ncbi:MAG TPA: hypothetical protein VMI73_08980 [Trebonia sp.]|nr:hypothetical protein [Trebonia sp.]
MHPQLMLSLAAERRRDMTADLNAHQPVPRCAARRRAPHLTVPRLRVTWSRTTLAAAGRSRGRSYVIVISATRTL